MKHTFHITNRRDFHLVYNEKVSDGTDTLETHYRLLVSNGLHATRDRVMCNHGCAELLFVA